MIAPARPRTVRSTSVEQVRQRIHAALDGDGAAVVTGITHDSREVLPGDLYLARPGARTHGIEHVDAALAAGATAVLTDPPSVPRARQAGATAVLSVPDPRAAGGPAAAVVYGDPAAALTLIGVTGTNGKTTTSYLLESGLRAAGHASGLIGTIETHAAGEVLPSVRTTPEATDLQALLAVMRERGVDAVTMEVSSHALVLDRVEGARFDVAAFTNLSQDHLDFHRDMEDYFAAKALLFTTRRSSRAVVNVDDDWGRRLARTAEVPVVTVGPVGSGADWTRSDERAGAAGGGLRLTGPDEVVDLDVTLPGAVNLRNAALAYVVLRVAGVDAGAAAAGIAALAAVPGRMERVDAGQPFAVFVDYAHTPEAVAVLVQQAREVAEDRVLVVLGCGGDRDRAKRPLMGAAAARADLAVLTSDNPRSEDPDEILRAMLAGVRAPAETVRVEPDRALAIRTALAAARPGDVVLIAGKGHEQGQEIGGEVRPFDDRVEARRALADLGYDGGAA